MNQLWKIIDFYFRVLYQMTWRVLDLFSGTDSVKKACVGLSFFGEVISLDLAKADINIDIMEWDYKQYPPGYFHVVWASPCCTCFSNLINHPAKGPAPPGKVFPPFCIIFFLPQMTTNSHLAYPRTSAVRGA